MVFSSIPFLYYFLPLVVLVYFLVPGRGRNTVLLLSSLVFYGWGEPKLLGLMVFTIVLFYLCGLAIGGAKEQKQKKFWLTVSVVISLALLGLFKYADFFIGSFNSLTGLSLPLLRLSLLWASASIPSSALVTPLMSTGDRYSPSGVCCPLVPTLLCSRS